MRVTDPAQVNGASRERPSNPALNAGFRSSTQPVIAAVAGSGTTNLRLLTCQAAPDSKPFLSIRMWPCKIARGFEGSVK